MEVELKKMGLKRNSTLGVGKKIGDTIWLYKSYISLIDSFNKNKPFYAYNINSFDVIKFNSKNNNVSLIKCSDFINEDEPTILKIINFEYINESYKLININCCNNKTNKQVYHHKWMFVKDDFTLFNVNESKKRSLTWKKILGINKSISSKIGYQIFWNNWLENNNLK